MSNDCVVKHVKENYSLYPNLCKSLGFIRPLKIGKLAPDFEGLAYHDLLFKKLKLSDYSGKWLVLFFYPLDFTFVCPTEIKAFNEKAD